MKKNLIALMAVVSILASGASVMATETAEPKQENQENNLLDAVPISEVDNDAALISESSLLSSYISQNVAVTEVNEGGLVTVVDSEKGTEDLNNVINYTVREDTLIYDRKGEKKTIEDIKKDSNITVFVGSYSPTILIFPPQYTANVIIINDEENINSVDMDTYLADGERFTNAANTLSLNISEDTKIVDREDKEVKDAKLENQDLIVFYDITTRSIPAQTNPLKVVVLGENELALAQIEAAKNEAVTPDETEIPAATLTPSTEVEYLDVKTIKVKDTEITNIYVKDETVMIPLRAVAEGLGLSVEWNGDIKAVTLNGGVYSLQIGENSYNKGKMMPIELKAAPEIKDDITYVPVEYFTQVVETTQEKLEDGVVIFKSAVEN